MAAKKKSTKKVTYAEFLAWLEGVESMQEENWTPSPTQWKTIREKLNTVKPDVEVKEVKVETAAAAPMTPMAPGPSRSAFEPMPQHNPVPLSNIQLQPSEHEGVPRSTTAPVLGPDGRPMPPGSEFL